MSDLVTRLRDEAQQRHDVNLEGDPIRFRDTKIEDDLRWQAAAEIERLRAALENARRDILYISPKRGHGFHMAEAAAERVKIALTQQTTAPKEG